ncbi:Hypothetical protein NCS54_00925200 [Fusarium falciforme]|uniref:Hypothetical protein n=1 Tax=Fusarium falciforme TaxID=195108 RepID=UPI002301A9E6|nr:Hypothetical protein NCS54_00925200 [Fusarium falciforme]WAO91770.1 Hypothetical protein NCS54_00925200 [Fusarium falciforme]
MVYVNRRPLSGHYPGGSSGGGGGVDSLPGVSTAGDHYDRYNPWVGRNTGGYYRSNGNDTDIDLPPIPVEWIISPVRIHGGECPSGNGTVTSFVVSDLVSCVLMIILFYPPVLKRITCGLMGRTNKSAAKKSGDWKIWFGWMFPLSLELLGNIVNTAIVVNSEGYEHLAFRNVFALYSSRPRAKVWLFSLLRFSKYEGEYIFADSYIGISVAEVILHIVMASFIGVTWRRFPNDPIKEWMKPLTTYMQVVPAILFLAVALVVPIWRRSGHPSWFNASFWDIVLACFFFGTVYAAPWAYWAHFLELPGSLWVTLFQLRHQKQKLANTA